MSRAGPFDSYRIYLLTVWREDHGAGIAGQTLRFRLEDPRTGQNVGFSDAAALMTFLKTNFGESGSEYWQNPPSDPTQGGDR